MLESCYATDLRLSLGDSDLPQGRVVSFQGCLADEGHSVTQAAGYALRVSCATLLLSSALGMAGIGLSPCWRGRPRGASGRA